MQSTHWVFVRRGGMASSLVALFLLCLPAMTPAGGPVAEAAETHAAAKTPLAIGSGYDRPRGSARVRVLQQRLRTLGQQPGPVDGLFGPLTEAAVKRFQSAAGLQVDGIAGPRTLRALRSEWPQPIGRGTGYAQRGGSDQVRAVQRRLKTADQRPGPVDGLFGPKTEVAVLRFQSTMGLAADGVVGRHTWRALERTRSRSVARDADKAIQRAVAALNPQTAGGRPALVLSQFPVESPDERNLDLLVLLVIGTMAFVVAWLGHTLARRLAAVPEGSLPELVRRVPGNPLAPGRSSARSPVADAREGDTVRAIGYVTGADPQALMGPGMRKQIAAIDSACDQHGWDLTEIVRDVTSRGGRANAPGLAYAVERLTSAQPSCLVVAGVGRLSGSAPELARIIRWLDEREVRLVAVNAELDTSTPEGRLAAEALISVGELEHERESQQSREGVPTATAKGGRISRPAVHDLPALRKHIVAMRSSGMSLQAIADRLNAEGVPTLRGGKLWRPSSVQVAAGYRRPGQSRRAGSLPQANVRSGKRAR